MAISTRFKQKCPSCEALVPIRDGSLIGKKIECPKCKFKFQVEDPAKHDKKAVARERDEELDDLSGDNGEVEEQVEELNEQEMQALIGARKKTTKERWSDIDEEESKKKSSKASNQKLMMGLILGGVGLVVLAVAGFFMLNSGRNGTKTGGPPPKIEDQQPQPKPPVKEEKKPSDQEPEYKVPHEGRLPPAGPEFTNLFPPNTVSVLDANLLHILAKNSPIYRALFLTRGAFKREELDGNLGFPLSITDRLIHTKSADGSLTAVHVMDTVNVDALKKALSLERVPARVHDQEYFKSTAPSPWFDVLAQIGIGVPKQIVEQRPLFVRLHDNQTIIFADEKPMMTFLNAKGIFPYQKAETPAPTETKEPPGVKPPGVTPPVQPPGKFPPGKFPPIKPGPGKGDEEKSPAQSPQTNPSLGSATTLKSDTFMTIKPVLKEMMDRLDARAKDSKDVLLVRSATEAEALNLKSFESFARRPDPRRLWDVLQLVGDRKPRLSVVGTALLQKGDKVFQLRNDIVCTADSEAKALAQVLTEESAFTVGRFIKRFLTHDVDLPKLLVEQAPNPGGGKVIPGGGDPSRPPIIRPGGPPGGNKDPKQPAALVEDEVAKKSRILVAHSGRNVRFTIDLLLDETAMKRVEAVAAMTAFSLRSEIDLASGLYGRHDLARAGKQLGEKGRTDRNVAPGNFPPGAFPRLSPSRVAREPSQRVSWMAALLPFLGQEAVYDRINFDVSWSDPTWGERGKCNWLVARTLIPQFIDPTYPSTSYYTTHPDLPFEAATTHYVGIAGVGLDAAEYAPNDPAYITKRGVFGYEKSASLLEIQNGGHGLSNTILVIQVPHDSLAGATPWLAGGGSTLRGVPETKSIAPFVLSTDRKGNPIQYKGKRGTYAAMTDGSVRWIDESVSDDVFKAMSTVKGPLPENFDLDQDEHTPLIPASKVTPKAPPKTDEGDSKEVAPPPTAESPSGGPAISPVQKKRKAPE